MYVDYLPSSHASVAVITEYAEFAALTFLDQLHLVLQCMNVCMYVYEYIYVCVMQN